MGTLTQTTAEVQVAIDGAYSSIYVDDNSTAQSIATGASYVKIDAFDTDGNSSNCTSAAASDKITVTKSGTYHATVSCSFTGASSNTNWFGAIFVDGVEQPNCHFERKLGTGGDYGSVAVSGLLAITATKDVDFRVRHDYTSTLMPRCLSTAADKACEAVLSFVCSESAAPSPALASESSAARSSRSFRFMPAAM